MGWTIWFEIIHQGGYDQRINGSYVASIKFEEAREELRTDALFDPSFGSR